MMRTALIVVGLLLAAPALAGKPLDPGQGGPAASGKTVLYPAERSLTAWGRKLLVRFDLSTVNDPEAIGKARLMLSGKIPSGGVAVFPPATQWGGACPEFLKAMNEEFWNESRKNAEGYKVIPELFLFGDPDPEGSWAAVGCRKWKTGGGDYGEKLGAIGAEAGGASLDLTALAKSWAADPAKNTGLMLCGAGNDPVHALEVELVLEGTRLRLEESPHIRELPAWLPRTYKASHPRLPYPTEDWLAALKADPKRLAELCKKADVFSPAKPSPWDVTALILAQKLAPSPERAAKVAQTVDGAFSGTAGAYGLAVFYDWGYDLLNPEQRRRAASRLERMATGLESACAEDTISPFNDVGYCRYGNGAMMAALAIYPDVPLALKHVWRAKTYHLDTELPVWRLIMGEHGGYWHEMSCFYYAVGLVNHIPRVLSSWSSATGQDLYRENPWLEHHLYWSIYATRPDMAHIHLGDGKCDERFGMELPLLPPMTLVRHYDNPYARTWMQKAGGAKFDGVTPSEWPWGPPIPKDVPVKPIEELPLVRHADGLGMVEMRSDWSEDGTFVWFRCGPSFWSHSHQDGGSFMIYKRGTLALDAGHYGAGTRSQHHTEYMLQSVAHNVVTVTDPAEKAVAVPGKDGLELPNDGGQRWTVSTTGAPAPYSVHEFRRKADIYDTGHIVAFQTTPEFTYVCGDATAAYTNPKSGTGDKLSRNKRVRKMFRSLVFLPPDHLVVFDQVESFDKGFKKRWLLHSVNEPKVEGNLTTVENAGAIYQFSFTERFRGLKYGLKAAADHPFFKEHPDCKFYAGYQPQLYQNDGVMFVRALLPEKPEIVTVGGDGKECWVDGKNRMGTRSGKDLTIRPYTREGEAGRWRIELSPSEAAENDLFLNVIQVGTKSQNPKPTGAKLLPVKDGTGLEVELGAGRKATLTLKPGTGGHIRIEGGGRPAVDAVLSEKVLPSPKIEK